MGILDETATEDDYVEPETTWNMWDKLSTPAWELPEIIQGDTMSNLFGGLRDVFSSTKDEAWNGNGIYDSVFDKVVGAPVAGASWLAEETADIFSRGFGGEELSPLEFVEAVGGLAGGALKSFKLGKAGLEKTITNLAPGMGITRGKMPYHTSDDNIIGWYDGILGKTKEMSKMVGSMSTQFAKNLYSPKANVLWNKYGISDLEKKELTKVISDMQSKGGYKDQHYNHIITQMQSNKTLRDKFGKRMPEFLKDMESVLFPKSVTTKGVDLVDSSVPLHTVLPDLDLPPDAIRDHMSAPMVKKLGMEGKENIQVQTKVWESNPLQETVFKNTQKMPDGDTYIKQMEQPQIQGLHNDPNIKIIQKKKGKDGKVKRDLMPRFREDIKLPNGKKVKGKKIRKKRLFTETADKFIKSENMFPSSTQSAMYLWKTAPDGFKFDQDGINYLLGWNNSKYKQRGKKGEGEGLRQGDFMVDPFDLAEEMIDSGNYISFGGKRLGQDKLLGTYDTRFIIDKKTGDAYMFIYDEMQLGSPSKKLDRSALGGAQEQVYVDFFKLERGSGTAAKKSEQTMAEAQRGVKSSDLANEIGVTVQDIIDNGVTPEDIARFKARRAKQIGAGATGVGILNYDEN